MSVTRSKIFQSYVPNQYERRCRDSVVAQRDSSNVLMYNMWTTVLVALLLFVPEIPNSLAQIVSRMVSRWKIICSCSYQLTCYVVILFRQDTYVLIFFLHQISNKTYIYCTLLCRGYYLPPIKQVCGVEKQWLQLITIYLLFL